MKAIGIIEDEHRSITAVTEGLRHVVDEILAGRMAADLGLLAAMFSYIERFPERLHHPKEDDFLFPRLRSRRPDAIPLLDELAREHEVGRERFRALRAAFERYTRDASALPEFARLVEDYGHFQWLHLRKEEDQMMPLARESLTAEDWNAIDEAFTSHSDPIVGTPVRREFRELFRRVVEIAPPPYGVGEKREE